MRILLIVLILGGLTSCGLSIKENRTAVIENDSIYFESIRNTTDYSKFSTFILKFPESKYFEEALKLYYQRRESYYDSIGWPIIDCFRNCANIKIRPNQEILFEYEKIEISDIKDSLLSFLINEDFSDLKPECMEITDLNGIVQIVSKGHVELTYVKDSCEILQKTLKEISHSYNLYINHLSNSWYNKEFIDLDKLKKNHLDSLFQYRLLLYEFDKEYLPPPPPPAPEPEELKNIEEEILKNE